MMVQFEPGTHESIIESVRIRAEFLLDFTTGRIHLRGHVGVGHDQFRADRWIFNINRHVFFFDIDRFPLLGTGRVLLQLPLVIEQHVEVTHVKLGRVKRPGSLDTTGHGIAAITAPSVIVPAQALLFEISRFGFRTQ